MLQSPKRKRQSQVVGSQQRLHEGPNRHLKTNVENLLVKSFNSEFPFTLRYSSHIHLLLSCGGPLSDIFCCIMCRVLLASIQNHRALNMIHIEGVFNFFHAHDPSANLIFQVSDRKKLIFFPVCVFPLGMRVFLAPPTGGNTAKQKCEYSNN